jgi:hypothetical protein
MAALAGRPGRLAAEQRGEQILEEKGFARNWRQTRPRTGQSSTLLGG